MLGTRAQHSHRFAPRYRRSLLPPPHLLLKPQPILPFTRNNPQQPLRTKNNPRLPVLLSPAAPGDQVGTEAGVVTGTEGATDYPFETTVAADGADEDVAVGV